MSDSVTLNPFTTTADLRSVTESSGQTRFVIKGRWICISKYCSLSFANDDRVEVRLTREGDILFPHRVCEKCEMPLGFAVGEIQVLSFNRRHAKIFPTLFQKLKHIFPGGLNVKENNMPRF